MSYILDALKKAERERGITQVPTITTVHGIVAAPRRRLWIVSAILVLCFAVVLWLFLPSFHNNTASVPSEGDVPGRKVPRSDLESMEESQADPSSQQSSITPVSRNLALSDEIPKDKTRMNPVTHDSFSQNTEDVTPVKKQRDVVDEYGSEQRAEAVPDSFSGSNSPGISPDKEAAVSQTNANLTDSKPAAQPSDNVRGKSASLRDAMAGMAMSVLMFSEIKSERLVFINGRKYVEGDYVQEDCLLESITPEGAVLNYKGERAILRPGSR